jgi:large subunit ribosomal protein L25
MAQQIELNAEPRTDVGKGASRRLRRSAGRVPGVIYGGDEPAQPLTLAALELARAMQQERFLSQIISVSAGGKTQQAVVRDVHRHPSTEKVLHIDFLRVHADREIEVRIPIHFLNEEKCVGVRLEGGLLSHNLIEVEVTCLPANLPQYIDVDVAELHLGDALHLSDLKLPEGVRIASLAQGEDYDLQVASVYTPRAEVVEAPVAAVPVEGEAVAAAEGEPAAEADKDKDKDKDRDKDKEKK